MTTATDTTDEQMQLPQTYAMIDTDGRPMFTAVHAEGFALVLNGGCTIQRADQLARLSGVVQRALMEAIEREQAEQRAKLADELRPRAGEIPTA